MNYLNKIKHLFKAPQKPNTAKHESSLLELFLDLIWVALLAGGVHQITEIIKHAIEHNEPIDIFSLLYILFELSFMIFLWKILTFYNSRYEEDTPRHRIIMMLFMLGMAFLVCGIFIEINHDLEKFALLTLINFFGFLIVFLTFFYAFFSLWKKWSNNPYEKKLLFRSLLGNIFSSLIMLPSFIIVIYDYLVLQDNNSELIDNLKWIFFFPSWLLGLMIWIMFEWYSKSSRIILNIQDFSQNHIKDRQNVIFIVFIGEVFLTIFEASEHFNTFDHNVGYILESVMLLISCFIIMFLWWWTFNDTINFPNVSNNPRKLNAYSFFGLLILVALIFHAVGFSLLIDSFFSEQEENIYAHNNNSEIFAFWGKLFVSIGIIIWLFGQVGMFYCVKHYRKSIKIILKLMPWFLFSGFITSVIFFVFTFFASITQVIYIYLLLSINIFSVIFIILSTPLIMDFSDEEINLLIKKEEKGIADNFMHYIDIELHKKNKYSLNYYSKFILKKK